jgi:mRNA-degrading endonuclease RelE of RelBE toxin-antitoxin system
VLLLNTGENLVYRFPIYVVANTNADRGGKKASIWRLRAGSFRKGIVTIKEESLVLIVGFDT